VILFTLVGLAVSKFFGIKPAVPVAMVLGLLLAPLVPAKTACSIPAPKTVDSGAVDSGTVDTPAMDTTTSVE